MSIGVVVLLTSRANVRARKGKGEHPWTSIVPIEVIDEIHP